MLHLNYHSQHSIRFRTTGLQDNDIQNWVKYTTSLQYAATQIMETKRMADGEKKMNVNRK